MVHNCGTMFSCTTSGPPPIVLWRSVVWIAVRIPTQSFDRLRLVKEWTVLSAMRGITVSHDHDFRRDSCMAMLDILSLRAADVCDCTQRGFRHINN